MSMNFYEQYDERLNGEERALVARADDFCSGGFSQAVLDAFNRGEAFEKSWIDTWAREGFLGLQTRKDHGGLGASYLCKLRVAQVMAEHSFAAAFAINNLQGSVTRLSKTGTDVQIGHLLERMRSGEVLGAPAMSEPEAGSDLGALTTTARRTSGGWIINGTKSWVTNGTIVGCVTLLARVAEGAGEGEIASFLTPLDGDHGLAREEILVPGGRSFRLGKLTFTDYFVPDWCLFNAPGEAFKTSMGSINAARVHVAAMCVASLRAALAETARHGVTRRSFGQPLNGHQGWRWEVAEVALRLEAANALVFRAAAVIEKNGPAVTLAAQAKKFAVDTSIWGIDQCIRAMGAIGATTLHRLSMLYAETRMAAFGDGTSEMLLDRIGKNLAKDYGAKDL
jgi:alkylation response protein AidB-like acyl-CoA dehydrogenase